MSTPDRALQETQKGHHEKHNIFSDKLVLHCFHELQKCTTAHAHSIRENLREALIYFLFLMFWRAFPPAMISHTIWIFTFLIHIIKKLS